MRAGLAMLFLVAGLGWSCSSETSPGTAGTGGEGGRPGEAGSGGEGGAGGEAGGGGVAGGGAGGAIDEGERVQARIGVDGGSLSLDGATLTIPAGALDHPVELTLIRVEGGLPQGYHAYSPLYRLEPEGMILARPAILALPFTGEASLARLFWSRQGSAGFERQGGVAAAGTLEARITRLASGFVADGVDFAEAADPGCARTRLVEGRAGAPVPSAVAAWFTVEDCQGRPIEALDCGADGCDFLVEEDDVRLPAGVGATLVPARGADLFVSLVLELGEAGRAQLPALIDGARAFVHELSQAPGSEPRIAIELFAGEAMPIEWQPPTLDADLVLERLGQLQEFSSADPSSANLHGALVQAIERQRSYLRAHRERNLGGALAAGVVVAFTVSGDTASLRSASDVAAAVEASGARLSVLALAPADPDPASLRGLSELGTDRVVIAEAPGALFGDLSFLGRQAARLRARAYFLAYCSPKRGGIHTTSIRFRGDPESAASFSIDAGAFSPGCSAQALAGGCEGRECGGLACGSCDDREASCDGLHDRCRSFCAQVGKCGGEEFVNPLGYLQRCEEAAESLTCGESCVDTTRDPAHCGACGAGCGEGWACADSSCSCPHGRLVCGASCLDVSRDRLHCGGCDVVCGGGEICGGGSCLDPSWSQWPPPPDAPPASNFAIDGETVRDSVTGLVWTRAPSAEPFDWAQAKRHCEELVAGGFSDWRLPSLVELLSIVDFGKMAPSILPEVFPSTPPDWFWTSTLSATTSYRAWALEFGGGSSSINDVLWTGWARCVR